jgi:predicted transcriptional regulator
MRREIMVTMRVTPEEAARLSEISRKTLRSRSDILRLLLAQAEVVGWDAVLTQRSEKQEVTHAR